MENITNAPTFETMHLGNLISLFNKENGPSKSNLFLVRFTPPPATNAWFNTTNANYMTQTMHFLCEESEFPGRALVSSDVTMGGLTTRFPYQTVYENTTMNFICSNTFAVKELFDNWQNMINPTDRYEFNYKDDYSTTIDIFQFDDSGQAVYFKKLHKAFPLMVNPLSLSWGAQNTLHKLSVIFNFDYWSRGDRNKQLNDQLGIYI